MATPSPLVLEEGLAVSAKYRGAWCEGIIKKVERVVKVKIAFEGKPGGTAWVDSSHVKGTLEVNNTVEAQQPEGAAMRKGTVQSMKDNSVYTVRFYDGDVRTLRRGQVKIMGRAHFETGQTLQDFPLTDPDSFGSPVDPHTPGEGRAGRKRRRLSDQGMSPSSPVPSDGRRRSHQPSPHAPTVPEAEAPEGHSHEVVLVNPCDSDAQFWWPALVVPEAEVTKAMTCGEAYEPGKQFVVRFFQDRRYAIIELRHLRLLARGTNPFVSFLRIPAFQSHPAVQQALRFIDTGELPARFKWSTFDSSVDESDHEDDWVPDTEAEARFQTDYEEFCAGKGLKQRRNPSLGFRDLDLFRLFTVVQQAGGSDSVTEQGLWTDISRRLGHDRSASGAPSLLNAYEKYLKEFEQHFKEKNPDKDWSKPADKGESADEHVYAFQIGDMVKAQSQGQNYTARVESRAPALPSAPSKLPRYKVHYNGWSKRYDEWLREDQLEHAETISNNSKVKASSQPSSKAAPPKADPPKPTAKAGPAKRKRPPAKPSSKSKPTVNRRQARSKRPPAAEVDGSEGDDDEDEDEEGEDEEEEEEAPKHKRSKPDAQKQQDAATATAAEESVTTSKGDASPAAQSAGAAAADGKAAAAKKPRSRKRADPKARKPTQKDKREEKKKDKEAKQKQHHEEVDKKPERSKTPQSEAPAEAGDGDQEAVPDEQALFANDPHEEQHAAMDESADIIKQEDVDEPAPASERQDDDSKLEAPASEPPTPVSKPKPKKKKRAGAKSPASRRGASTTASSDGGSDAGHDRRPAETLDAMEGILEESCEEATQLVAPSALPTADEIPSCYSPSCRGDFERGCYSSLCDSALRKLARKVHRRQKALDKQRVVMPDTPEYENLSLSQKMSSLRRLYNLHSKSLRELAKRGHSQNAVSHHRR